MRTVFTILAVAGGLVALVLVGVAIAVWTVDPNSFVKPIEASIKAATGRDVAIGGGIRLELGLTPKLVATDVRISNAEWGKAPDLVSAKKVEARVALLPLLQRRFELVRLDLLGPVITLETNAEGRGNWELAAAPSGTSPPTSASAAPVIGFGNIAIIGGTLTYRDGATGSETNVAIDELSIRARDAESPVNAEFRGRIDGIAVALTGSLGPLATLAQRRLPYPLMVQGDIGGRKTSIVTKLQRDDGLVELQDLDVTSGATNVKGRVSIRTPVGARAMMTINLDSPSLTLADLPIPVTAKPAVRAASTGAAARSHYIFSDVPLPFEGLRARDAEGTITIGNLLLPDGRSLTGIHAQFTLRDGKLDVPSIKASVLGGVATGAIVVNAAVGQTPTIHLSLTAQDLDLSALLAMAGIKREVRGGKSELAVDVTMRGASPRQWANGVSGSMKLVVGPATLVNTKADPSVALDRLAQAVNPFRATEPVTELRCGVIRLPLADGIAHIDHSIGMETKELDASVTGTLDFRNETLDLSISPRLKQGVPIDIGQLSELVHFRGPFAAPVVAVDALGAATVMAKIGAAVGTGGLSAVGSALISRGGPGACATAAGKTIATTASATDATQHGGAQAIVDDIGKALGKLLPR